MDYVCGVVVTVLSLLFFAHSGALGAVSVILGVTVTAAAWIWESKRRTVSITYDLDDDSVSLFKQVISAFNNLASNKRVWVLQASRDIKQLQEAKLNAGAGRLVDRIDVQIGEGNPPWVVTNISVPVLTTKATSLYMMPDGILVYDKAGVGFVDYEGVSTVSNTTNFIEERPPRDSMVVGQTWKHPNKDGGPDKRFKDNYQIPICLYGELQISSQSGLFLYLMTSKHDTPSQFCQEFANVLEFDQIRRTNSGKTQDGGKTVGTQDKRQSRYGGTLTMGWTVWDSWRNIACLRAS